MYSCDMFNDNSKKIENENTVFNIHFHISE